MNIDLRISTLYVKYDKPVDRLPYTQELALMLAELNGAGHEWSFKQLWDRLILLRKQGKLPRLTDTQDDD